MTLDSTLTCFSSNSDVGNMISGLTLGITAFKRKGKTGKQLEK